MAKLRPGLPVVISSGDVTGEFQSEAPRLVVRALLQKQNTMEEMPALIHRVLGEPAQSTRAE